MGTKRVFLLFAAAAALAVALPEPAYAQFGGLANMAKGKAVEMLTGKVMEELEKKFAEAVANQPVSEAAKAAAVKKLSELAHPIVKRFIDGAASGKLPNPLELAQTVLKEVLPRVPEIVAAVRGEGGSAPSVPAAYPAREPASAYEPPQPPAREAPRIAVYVFGAEDPAINKAMADRLIAAIDNSGRYRGADNYREFFEQAVALQPPGGATHIGTEQIKNLARGFGLEHVCVAEIAAVFGANQASAHILNVETAEIKATGIADMPLKTPADLTAASDLIVKAMFKGMRDAAPPAYTQTPPAAPAAEPEQQAYRQQPYQQQYQQQPYQQPYQPYEAGYRQAPPPNAYGAEPPRGEIYDFSGGERFGTFALNWMIPGLGSATIMQDWPAFGWQLGLYGLGWSLIGNAIAAHDDDVTVPLAIMGGAAFTGNFVFNIARSATYKKPGSIDRPKVKRTDFYFSPKYQFPAGTPVAWGGTNVEFGWIWGDGMFFGVDLNFGLSRDENYSGGYYTPGYYDDWGYYHEGYYVGSDYESTGGALIGAGLSIGKAHELSDYFQIAYGGSAGFWFVDEFGRHRGKSYNFLAPFVKLRLNVFELTYRGLLGIREEYSGYNDYYGSYYDDYNTKFGWNSHQLMLGFYFATKNRQR